MRWALTAALLLAAPIDTARAQAPAAAPRATLDGVTIVRGFLRLFTGSRPRGAERDVVPRERVVLTVSLGALIVAGLWPAGPLAWRGPRPDHVDEPGSP